MSTPKGPPNSGDTIRQQQIEELDHEAHERYDMSRAFATHARLEDKISNTWEEFGEAGAAENARRDAAEDLASANSEDERVYELLVLMRVLRDAQSNAGVAKLRTAAPQLRSTLLAVSTAIQDNVSESSETRQYLERLYQQLIEQLAHSVSDRSTAVALLENLELYLKGVQQLAHVNSGVREAWLVQADVLTTIL